jgi:site-specific DNA recombinase
VRGRRQRPENPDSDQRERRCDPSEWVELDILDLHIVSGLDWEAARSEMTIRWRRRSSASQAGKQSAKHLLSSLIRCSIGGSSYTISVKDHYRCAAQKERGTYTNSISVRKKLVETATPAILQSHLLSEEHARICSEEFQREAARLVRLDSHADEAWQVRP